MPLVDARTGVVHETVDSFWAAMQEQATALHGPPCPHGLRVPCRKCEAPEPPRRRNTWSDERDVTAIEAAPAEERADAAALRGDGVDGHDVDVNLGNSPGGGRDPALERPPM